MSIVKMHLLYFIAINDMLSALTGIVSVTSGRKFRKETALTTHIV